MAIAKTNQIISISIYLPDTDESNEWLYFAISELIYEFNRQFNEDGTNFESSTTLTSHFLAYILLLVIPNIFFILDLTISSLYNHSSSKMCNNFIPLLLHNSVLFRW